MGGITKQMLRSLLQYWLPMEDVWFSFSSLTLYPATNTQAHRGAQLNYTLLLVWTHLQSNYMLEMFMHKLYNLPSKQHILYMVFASKPISNLQLKCCAVGVCRTYSIIHLADIKSESLVGCLLKSWPRPPLIKLIHGFNKWGTGSRCACRCTHKAHRHPSHWSGIFSFFAMQHSHTTPADVAGSQPSHTTG